MIRKDHTKVWDFDNILDATRREVTLRLTNFLAERRAEWKDNPRSMDEVTAADLTQEFFNDRPA